jgi:D-alanyl-D-alanine carboxypeptidase
MVHDAPSWTGSPISKTVVARLSAAFADLRGFTESRAISAACATPEGVWHEDWVTSTLPTQQNLLFPWWSIGKVFTARLTYRFATEGKLRLDAPVSSYDIALPNAHAATLQDALDHTAGWYSYNEDAALRASPRHVLPEEAFAIASRHGALFCPGAAYRYSNSGYAAIGRALEYVAGRPFPDLLQVTLAQYGQGIAALGLGWRTSDLASRVLPLTTLTPHVPDPSFPYAAGCVVATATTMAQAWLGHLADMRKMPTWLDHCSTHLYPHGDSGLYLGAGLGLYTLPNGHWLGFSGGTPGADAIVVFDPQRRVTVAVSMLGSKPNAAASANLLIRTVSS